MEIQFKIWRCDLHFETYENDYRALRLTDVRSGKTISHCTIYLPELLEDELAIRDYSENKGIYKILLDYRIIIKAHRFIIIDGNKVPICYLNWEGGAYD